MPVPRGQEVWLNRKKRRKKDASGDGNEPGGQRNDGCRLQGGHFEGAAAIVRQAEPNPKSYDLSDEGDPVVEASLTRERSVGGISKALRRAKRHHNRNKAWEENSQEKGESELDASTSFPARFANFRKDNIECR